MLIAHTKCFSILLLGKNEVIMIMIHFENDFRLVG